MKQYFGVLCAGLAIAGAFSGCSSDDLDNGHGNKPTSGATVNFALSNTTTRTEYDDENEFQINWNNGDKIRIFCNEAEDVKQADYTVIKSIDPDKEHAGKLQYNESGLAWGGDNITHNFFAVYPADNNKVSVADGIASFSINLDQVCELPTTPDGNGNYMGTPDMTNAYMVAHLATTPIDEVPLHFDPIMTTLKVTVRGRETTNMETVTITGISIINNNVQSPDAGQGKFQYDIANGTIVNAGNTGVSHTETTFVRVKQGDNYHIDLEAGQSVTLTVFLPPLPIDAENPVTVRVHATGETVQEVTIGGNMDANGNPINLAAGSKTKLTLPWFPTEATGNLWMTPLDDDIYVSQLSIPGTHDAATRACDLSSGKCQTRTIAEQLEMGIRCFDLRPAASMFSVENDNALPIYHGVASCNIDLKEVYEAFNTFLNEHPGEFIITIIRWESERLAVINAESRFNKAMNNFVGTSTYTSHALPRSLCKKDLTIGEARGKILSIMRPNQGTDPDGYFTNTAPSGMMFVSGFPGSHAEGTQQAYLKEQYVDYGNDQWGHHTDWILYCQNYYEVNNESNVDASISAKIASVERYLDLARDEAAKGSHVWTINHCSGYAGGSAISSAYARLGQEVNLPVYNYLMNENRTPGSTGIVLLDYVGDRVCQDYTGYTVYGDLLPQAIIDNNYKYRMQRKTN